jgi:hypothetical protein
VHGQGLRLEPDVGFSIGPRVTAEHLVSAVKDSITQSAENQARGVALQSRAFHLVSKMNISVLGIRRLCHVPVAILVEVRNSQQHGNSVRFTERRSSSS